MIGKSAVQHHFAVEDIYYGIDNVWQVRQGAIDFLAIIELRRRQAQPNMRGSNFDMVLPLSEAPSNPSGAFTGIFVDIE